MNFISPLCIMLLFSCSIFNKSNDESKCTITYDGVTGDTVYIYVDEEPQYPGGIPEIMEEFMKSFKYPEEETFQAYFELEFIITKSGSLISPRIVGKKTEDLNLVEKEAIRVLTTLEQWSPGKCKGKPVPVKMFLPLRL